MARFFIMNDFLNRESDTDSDSSNDVLIHYSTKKFTQSDFTLLPEEVSKMCRICLSTNSYRMTDIFEGKVVGNKIFLSISEFTKIYMTKEELMPHSICDSCLNLLTCAITFKDLCLKSDNVLRNAIKIKKECDEKKPEVVNNETKDDVFAEVAVLKTESVHEDYFECNDDTFDNDEPMEPSDYNFEVSLADTKVVKEEVVSKSKQKAKVKLKKSQESKEVKEVIEMPAKRLFSCKYCRKIYKNATVFNNHMIREHAQIMDVSNPKGTKRKNPTPAKIHENSVCDLCELVFDNKNKLLVHLKVEHFTNQNVSCKKCQKNFDDLQQYLKHQQMHKNLETYLCEWCAKPFKSANNLKAHLRIHNNEFPFACSQCPYRARVKDALRSHMRTHTGERPYACDACPATFSCKSNLNGHIRRTHKQIKAYKCPVCGKEFSARQPMLDHKSCQHDGIKRYTCPVCGSQFGYKKGLRKHLINVHKKEKRAKLGKVPNYQIAQEKELASQQLIAQGFF